VNDKNAEDFLPHRGKMKLIDKIIHINKEQAVTESFVNYQWPLLKNKHVSPIILIELVAQTAGIYIAWNKEKEKLRTGKEKGWVVGINSASFFIDQIQINTIISTRTSSALSIDNYMKINGQTYIGESLAGEIGLQLFWVESDEK
jgi:predicted hotdog family 3-hydroxylacyl-ACP dehydratase